jgi:hypothetical protein
VSREERVGAPEPPRRLYSRWASPGMIFAEPIHIIPILHCDLRNMGPVRSSRMGNSLSHPGRPPLPASLPCLVSEAPFRQSVRPPLALLMNTGSFVLRASGDGAADQRSLQAGDFLTVQASPSRQSALHGDQCANKIYNQSSSLRICIRRTTSGVFEARAVCGRSGTSIGRESMK